MWGSVYELVGDTRIAFRSLRRAPGVLLITVISLGVGIGAMTSVFGIANSFLFQGAVGIEDPSTLVAIYTSEDDGEAYGVSSFPDYLEVRAEIDAIEDASAVQIRTLAGGETGDVKALLAEEVTGNYFTVTGIRPVIGRGFLPEEGAGGSTGARTVVISSDMWESDFGGDPGVLGRELRLNGYVHTIVGVAPDGVMSRRVPLEPDVWVPLGSIGVDNAALRGDRGHRGYLILARLSEGSSPEALSSQLSVLSSRLQDEYRAEWYDEVGNPRALSTLGEGASRLRPGARAAVGGFALFFMSAAGLVLLIACANVTTLFLARAAHRSREMAVRLSLGASRRRLIGMFLIEGLLPGIGAGAIGLGVTAAINQAMNAGIASLPFGIPLRTSFGIDGRVIGVTILLSLGASLVFSLVPALEGSKPDLVRALKGDGSSSSRGHRLRSVLVGVQCAASVVLLVGATLFVRSLGNAAEVDVGMNPDRIAVATKKLDAEGFSPEEGQQYIRDLRTRLASRDNVEMVHVSRSLEMTLMSVEPTIPVQVEAVGYTPLGTEADRVAHNSVTPGYLEMLEIQLVRGRGIEEGDVAGAPLVAVVNETFAERLWPGEDPIGRTFQSIGQAPAGSEEATTEKRAFQVVGVAKDGKYFDFDDGPTQYYWSSIFQDYSSRIVVSAKGTVEADGMIPLLREEVSLASGEVQFTPPTSLEQQFSLQFIHLRVAARVLRWGGAFGLFLAVIGIYGIVSFAVTQRTREMAIRMAIGAEGGQVLRGVIRDGMRPALIGLAVGAVFAFLGARLIVGVLVGVSPMDPRAFGGGMAILGLSALVASVLPALRALRIDPMQTLREE